MRDRLVPFNDSYIGNNTKKNKNIEKRKQKLVSEDKRDQKKAEELEKIASVTSNRRRRNATATASRYEVGGERD